MDDINYANLSQNEIVELLENSVAMNYYNEFQVISIESTIELFAAESASLELTSGRMTEAIYDSVKKSIIAKICENLISILGQGFENIDLAAFSACLENIVDVRRGDYRVLLKKNPDKAPLNSISIVNDMYSMVANGLWFPMDVFGDPTCLEKMSYDDLKILAFSVEQTVIISDTFVGNIRQGLCQLQELLAFQLAFFKAVHISVIKNYKPGKAVRDLLNKSFDSRFNDIIQWQREANSAVTSSKLFAIDKNFIAKSVEHIRNAVGTSKFSGTVYTAINRLINTQLDRIEVSPIDTSRMTVKQKVSINDAREPKFFYNSVETIISQWNQFVKTALIPDKSIYLLQITSKNVVNVLI